MQNLTKGLLLALYSFTGNLISLVGFRWVDYHNLTYFRTVYREANILSIWSIISSLILLFSILYFCSSTRFNKNSKKLGIIVFCVIIAVFFVTIPMNFASFSYYIEETDIIMYPPVFLLQLELLLAGITGVLTATSFFNVSDLCDAEKRLFLDGTNKILGSLISLVFFLIISGGVLTMFSALNQFVYVPKTFGSWLVMFPLLFFYLAIGIIVWLIEVYSKIRTAEKELFRSRL
jgi:hypothetical protein